MYVLLQTPTRGKLERAMWLADWHADAVFPT
jgi:hypothetical protein